MDLPGALGPLEDGDPCWCGSDKEYSSCHGDWSWVSAPGADVPPDDGDLIWLSPRTKTNMSVFVDAAARDKPNLYIPPPGPAPRAIDVSPKALELVAAPPEGYGSLAEAGRARLGLLREYGFANSADVDDRLASMGDEALAECLARIAQVSRSATSLLLYYREQDVPPTVIWADSGRGSLVGQTLLWADHYLVPDAIASQFISGRRSREAVASSIRDDLAQAPLIEAGIVVPVPSELVLLAVSDEVFRETASDLSRPDMVEWLRDQLVVEGPTAREALFFYTRDDFDEGDFELLAHIVPESIDGEAGTFGSLLLQPFDKDADYGPWIGQQVDKQISNLAGTVNAEIASATAFGGTYLSRRPFRARYAAAKGFRDGDLAPHLAHLAVPALAGADPHVLADLALQPDVVRALRDEVRTTFLAVRENDFDLRVEGLQRRVDELSKEASEELTRRISSERVKGVGIPGALAAGSVLLLGVTPAGLVAAALAAGAAIAPYSLTVGARRREPAYAFWRASQG